MKLAKGSAITLLLSLCLLSTLGFKSCSESKSDFVFWGEQVVGAATDAIPILSAAGVNTARAEQFRDYGQKLVAAIKANDGTALGYAASCINLLEQVANDARLIPDQGRRTTVLVILAIANVALHRLADNLPAPEARPRTTGAPRSIDRSVATIQGFKAKPKWRCRNAATGQYAAMSFCKEFPAQSVVETY